MTRESKQRTGKVLVILALTLPLILTLVAIAIGMSQLQSTRSQLAAIVDAAASTAADTYTSSGDITRAKIEARQVASENTVNGESIDLDDDDIEFGIYVRTGSEGTFTRNRLRPNAVRVTGRLPTDSDRMVMLFPWRSRQATKVEMTRTSLFSAVDRDIALVVDRGNSMAYGETEVPPIGGLPIVSLPPPPPPAAPVGWQWCMLVPANAKWLEAVASIEAFLGALRVDPPVEQVALVTFASDGWLDTPLSLDYSQILSGLGQRTREYCGGGSNKAEGIETAVEALTDTRLARPHAVKVIVLLTDNADDDGDPVAAARAAYQAGLIVHTISYGKQGNEGLAIQIASVGGGIHRHAEDANELKAALVERAARIPLAPARE